MHWASLLGQLSRFSLVGIAATLTYLLLANLLILTDAMAPAWASVLAYLTGMIVSFTGQARYTFRVRRHRPLHLLRFALLSVVGLGISFGLIRVAQYLHADLTLATIATAVAVPIVSYLTMRLWVFAEDAAD